VGKKTEIDLIESQIPVYDLSKGIILAIAQMGYDVSNITINQSEAINEDDYNMMVVNFTISGLPIMTNNVLFTDDTVNIAIGKATVSIHTVETTTENTYYVEDVITSSFRADSLSTTDNSVYTSKALDTLFFALLKSCIIINNTVASQA